MNRAHAFFVYIILITITHHSFTYVRPAHIHYLYQMDAYDDVTGACEENKHKLLFFN